MSGGVWVVGLLLLLLSAASPDRLSAQGEGAAPVRFSAYIQPRFQAVGDSATFLLRRARFALEGTLTPWASYRAQVEMRTAGAPPTPPASPLTVSITDLFVRLTHQRWTGTVGQFPVPFPLESLLRSGMPEPTERSRIVTAARRDIGAQLEWRIPDRVTLQRAGVTGQAPHGAAT